MDHLIAETYWDEIGSFFWSDAEFESAMRACRQELDRFPSIRQIKERYKKLEPPTVYIEPEQVSYTDRENQEIETMIRTTIANPRLAAQCRRIVGLDPPKYKRGRQ